MTAPFTPMTLELIRQREREGVIASFVANELGWELSRLRRVCVAHGIFLTGLDATATVVANVKPSSAPRVPPPAPPPRRFRSEAPEMVARRNPAIGDRPSRGLVRNRQFRVNTTLTPPDQARVMREMSRRSMTQAGFVGMILEALIDTNGFDAVLGPVPTRGSQMGES